MDIFGTSIGDGIIGAGISAIGGLLGNDQSAASAQAANEFSAQQYATRYQTTVKDMQAIKELLARVAGEQEESMVQIMAIRAMAKAEYSTNNIGHFGLAFSYYSHFTSPIRRYPDVLVHRLLDRYIQDQGLPNVAKLDLHCKHDSMMEKRAADAERASIKYKQVEYLLMRKDQIFSGKISGITNGGLFVELEGNKCEGFLPIEDLGFGFHFDKAAYIMVNQRGEEIHLGDELEVKVKSGDMLERQIIFSLVD